MSVARAALFSDGEIAEIIAYVALNVFTNYLTWQGSRTSAFLRCAT